MKAFTYDRYGPPEVVHLEEVPMPEIQPEEILVEVHATTVNRSDCGFRKADPFIARFFTGLFGPKRRILGSEFSGKVVDIGNKVTRFKVGDEVFGHTGDQLGAHAEYLKIHQDHTVVRKPENLDHLEAASITDGAMLAWNYLRLIHFKRDHRILINGATGSIGSAGLQLAKYMGADVAAVGNTPNLNLLKRLGADRVYDYLNEDFTRSGHEFDVVFDAVGKSTFGKCKRILRKKGTYYSTELGPWAQNPFLHLITPMVGGKQVRFPIPINRIEDFMFFEKVIREGKYQPIVDRVYPFERIHDAYHYVETGMKTGNVVIQLKEIN